MDKRSDAELQAAVARGMARLDEKRPGWLQEIDLARLQMDSCVGCVLGQVFHHYGAGRVAVLEEKESGTLFGFDADSPGEFRALGDLWRRVIRARQAGEEGAV